MVAAKTTSTITINLSEQVSRLLAERVSITGQELDEYVGELIVRDLKRPTLNEVLRPFQAAIEASGMTDQEFDELIEEAREERYLELHGKPSKRS